MKQIFSSRAGVVSPNLAETAAGGASVQAQARANLGLQTITAGSTAISFSTSSRQTLTISGATSFTGSGYTVGTSVVVYLTASGGPHSLTFPAGWVFQTPAPTQIGSGKQATLLLDSLSTSESGVRAFYTEQL
jgi:hypothetical protein